MLDLAAIEAQAREAKERADKATPGPWFVCSLNPDWVSRGDPEDPSASFVVADTHDSLEDGDAPFIAAARQDVPALCAHITALVAEVRLEREARERWYANLQDSNQQADRYRRDLIQAKEESDAARDALERVTGGETKEAIRSAIGNFCAAVMPEDPPYPPPICNCDQIADAIMALLRAEAGR